MADALRIQVGSLVDPAALTSGNTGTFALNQTTDALEIIFQVDEAVTITDLGFKYGTRTGTPPTYQISLQGVDTSGNPDGTIKGATNNALATFTPPANTSINNLWQWKTLTESYAAARGEWLALVIAYSSGTVDGSNNSTFASHNFLAQSGQNAHPYAITNDAGVRARAGNTPVYGFKTASATYGNVWQSWATTAYSNNSNPNEYALNFTIPATWFTSFQVVGCKVSITTPAAGKTIDFTLYDTDGTTVLQSVTWDSDYLAAAAASPRPVLIYFNETTLSTLTAGSTYRLGVLANEVTTSIALWTAVVATQTDFQGWPMGTQCFLSTRAGAGWTDTATASRPMMDLILKVITAPTGGGGHVMGGTLVR